MKKMIFGAGFYGKKALETYGEQEVEYYIDNNIDKQGTLYLGKLVLSPEEAVTKTGYEIVIASTYVSSMIKQLAELGIADFSVFVESVHPFYETKELIFNPYELTKESTSEREWSKSEKLRLAMDAVYDEAENLHKNLPLFNHVEVETINRCNGACEFCPVNHRDDPREKAIMSWKTYEKIITELEEIKYTGKFTTFSNNEPLLDERIIEWNQYAREHLPNARLHLYTNGTLLTIDKFIGLIEMLDELIIDNYHQELKLIKPVQEIASYCEKHPELKEKVTIVLRKPKEILTTRGGTSPNRKEFVEYGKERCVLPYKQLIIRPTGQISLCCNDAIGKYTLGDVNKERLVDIWYGSKFQMVRNCLYEGRENWGNCKFCDTFNLG